MPCDDYDWSDKREVVRYRSDPKDVMKIEELLRERKNLEACLCAMIMELEKLGIAETVMVSASKNGKVDLSKFWKTHSKEDEERLAERLKMFSEHEKEVLRRILNKKD